MGIGMALLEQTHVDPVTGRIVNHDLAEYLVPTHADIAPVVDAFFVAEDDDRQVNPIGVKGVGEVGTIGSAAAVANAVYHATGRRVRRCRSRRTSCCDRMRPMTAIATPSASPPVRPRPIPPLEHGDHLTRDEFERRWAAMPHVRHAELIDGRVYMPAAVAVPPPPRPGQGPRLPPLANGDHLTRAEFERRWEAMPHVTKAELIEGVVYMPAAAVSHEFHGGPHVRLATVLGTYMAATPGLTAGDNGSLRLDMPNMPQPDLYLMIPPEYGGQARVGDDGYVVGARSWSRRFRPARPPSICTRRWRCTAETGCGSTWCGGRTTSIWTTSPGGTAGTSCCRRTRTACTGAVSSPGCGWTPGRCWPATWPACCGR